MKIFVGRNGNREGPFESEEVARRLADGTFAPTDLAWFEGCPNWIPLAQVPGILPQPLPETAVLPGAVVVAPTVLESGPQCRPWVRYWARTLDIYIFSISVGLFIGYLFPGLLMGNHNILTGILALALWSLIEPIFMVTCYATPGKALLRIAVRQAGGSTLDFHDAIARSFRVWVQGMGLGIPLVSLATMIAAYSRLTEQGVTAWDKDGDYKVSHQVIGPWRVTAAILLSACLIGVMIFGLLHKKS